MMIPTTIDFLNRQVRRVGHPVELTNREYRILDYILSLRGKMLSRRRIIRLLHNTFSFLSVSEIERHLETLKTKIEIDPQQPEFIL